MGKCKLILLSLLLQSGTLALSQAHSAKDPGAASWDVYGGGAYIGSNPVSSALAGFGGGVDFLANHWVGGRADISAFRATSGVANTTTTVDYLVGPRIGKPLSGSRLGPFADFLVGVQTFHNGSTQHSYYYGNGPGFALAVDGGLDIGVSKHFAFRGQAGFGSVRYQTSPTATTNTRWRAGTFLVYRF